MSGRPQPRAIRILKGNPGRRPLPDPSPTPPVVDAAQPPPAWLTARAREIWTRQAPELVREQLLTALDTDMFGAWCQEMATYQTTKDPVVRARALRAARSVATELGLTPASRTRVTRAAPAVAPSNPLEKFLKR